MPTIHERVFSVLTAASVASGQIYPDVAPDSTTGDYIVFFSVASAPENTLASGIPIENSRFQFDCWSATRLGSRAVAAAVLAALVAQVTGEPGSPTNFRATLLTDQDDYDRDAKLYRTILDVSLWYYGDVL